MEKREAFAIEEGLHQAIVIKLSSGAPNLKDLRTLLLKHLGIKGHCLIGSLAPRQLLLSPFIANENGLQVRNLIVKQYTDEQEHNTSLKPINFVTHEMSQLDMYHIHDVVASSENSGQHSCLNVAKKSLDKNLEVDNLRCPSNSTHFEHSISEIMLLVMNQQTKSRVWIAVLARTGPW
ncbi:hypothetical protein BC332_16304 [Capsicum chinense]|nr:hypothetical protein BC332_16304 [Capsicum chinense]